MRNKHCRSFTLITDDATQLRMHHRGNRLCMHSATYRKKLLKKRTRQTSLSGEKTFCTYRVNMRIAVDESVSRAASLVQTLRTGSTSTNGVLRREDIYLFLTRRNIWETAFLFNGLLLAQRSVRPYCYFFTAKITIQYFFSHL